MTEKRLVIRDRVCLKNVARPILAGEEEEPGAMDRYAVSSPFTSKMRWYASASTYGRWYAIQPGPVGVLDDGVLSGEAVEEA